CEVEHLGLGIDWVWVNFAKIPSTQEGRVASWACKFMTGCREFVPDGKQGNHGYRGVLTGLVDRDGAKFTSDCDRSRPYYRAPSKVLLEPEWINGLRAQLRAAGSDVPKFDCGRLVR